jgi:6-phosphogluconate dehydrogenase
MEIGFVGLGKMGMNMVARLRRDKHRIVAYDRQPSVVSQAEGQGANGAASLEALASQLTPPRVVWVMVPAGKATEETIAALAMFLQRGDVIIDGGNTHYHDDVRRAAELKARGLHYVDVGTSG